MIASSLTLDLRGGLSAVSGDLLRVAEGLQSGDGGGHHVGRVVAAQALGADVLNARGLQHRLRTLGVVGLGGDLLTAEGLQMIDSFVEKALDEWLNRNSIIESFENPRKNPLYLSIDAYEEEKANTSWSVPYSLRDIAESSVINIKND